MDKKTYEKGLEIRTAVLGKEYVDKAMKAADDFNLPHQELVTEYCGVRAGAARSFHARHVRC